MNTVIEEVENAIKFAKSQDSEAISCTSEWLEMILDELDYLRIDNESFFQANKMLGSQNERLEADNAALKWKIERFQNMYERESDLVTTFHQKNEQLKAQNAALLECLETICACSTDDFVTSMYMVHEIQSLARECIAKLGGERNE